jgi:SAM-dependent methyltransferase
VAALEQALLETQHAFDGVAPTYGQSNAANRTLCAMRQRALDALVASVPPGSHVLDLGCGPGVDDEYLATRGYRVTGIDWSGAMAEEAERRVARAGLSDRVDIRHLGIHQLDALGDRHFDAAFSNLGPLNCVPDLERAARVVADRLRPGGIFIASVIGRICPWEIALYAARGNWPRLAVRFARGLTAVPLDGRTVWTRYYTPREFARATTRAGFRVRTTRALGLLAPPPYLESFAHRHPRLVERLMAADDRIGGWPGVRSMGDHFLIVLDVLDRRDRKPW